MSADRMLLVWLLVLLACASSSSVRPASAQQVGVGGSWLGLVTPRGSVTFWQQQQTSPSPYLWSVAEVPGSFVAVWLWADEQGMDHGCAIDSAQQLSCWLMGFAALSSEPSGFPAAVQVASVTRGRNHSCVLLSDQRTVQCVGDNAQGQLNVPAFPSGLSVMSLQASVFQSSSALTGNSACVLLSDHTSRCWGTSAAVSNPLIQPGSSFPPPDTKLWLLDHTSYISCGVLTSGLIECWPPLLSPFSNMALAQPPLSLVVSLSVCAASHTEVTLWAFLNVGPLIKLSTLRSSAIPWLSGGGGVPDLSGQLVSNHDDVCAAIGSDASMSVFQDTLTYTLDLSYSRGNVIWAAPSSPPPSTVGAVAPPVIFVLAGGTASCNNTYFVSPVPADPFAKVTGSLSVAPAIGCDFCALTASGALHCFGSAAAYAPSVPAPYASMAWLEDWLVVVNTAGAIAGVCSAARTTPCPVLPAAPAAVQTVDLTTGSLFYMLMRDRSLCSWTAGSACTVITSVPPLLSIANGCGITNSSSALCFAPAMQGSGWSTLPPLAYTGVVATDSTICALAVGGQLLCSSGPSGSPPPFPLNGPYVQMISDGADVMCLVLAAGQLFCTGAGVPSLTIVPAGATVMPGTFTQGALKQPCPPGTVSVSGVASSWLCSGLCSPGRYSLPGEPVPITATCPHVCPKGSYCEMGTDVPVPCPAGAYGAAEGQTDSGCSGACPAGYFCPAGSISPTANPCPSGRYGNTTALVDAFCSGNCTRGFSCPAGTIQPDVLPCGNAAIICPDATTNKIVPPGSYSICPFDAATNTTDYTRCYAEAPCAPGHFCLGGYNNPCQAGYWQPSGGTTACAQCDPGTYTDGTAATVCKQCAAGTFSTRQGTVECSLCPPGSISPGQGLAVPCIDCAAGRYSSADRTNCTRCDKNQYSGPAAAVCLNCDTAVSKDQSICMASTCDAGTEFIRSAEVGNTCWQCPIGLSSTAGGPCTLCPASRFGPQEQSPVCLDCSNAAGLLCAGGVASVLPGFWAYKIPVTEIYTSNNSSCSPDLKSTQCEFQTYGYATSPCPSEEYCPGLRALQVAGDINSITGNYTAGLTDLSPCVFPRSTAPGNILCGRCSEGYSPWGDACIRCTAVNGALLFLTILISGMILFFLYHTSGGSNGLLLIALFFAQTAMVQVGSVQSALSWLRFVNLDLKSTSQIGCPFPIGEYALVMADVLMPVILLTELAVGFVLHFIVAKIRKRCKKRTAAARGSVASASASFAAASPPPLSLDTDPDPEWPSLWSRWEEHVKSVDAEFEAAEHHTAPGAPSNPELSMSPRSAARAIKMADEIPAAPMPPARPSPDLGRYLQTARSVLEFSYTQVTAACLRYMSCTSVDGASVVFAQPSLRCDSAEWRSTLILVVVVLFVYVLSWPLMVLAVGWAQRRRAQWLELNAFGAAEVAAVTARPSLLVRLLSASSSIYHQPSWYWSALFLFRRVVILLIDSFSLSHYSLRVALFTNVHLLSLLLHLNRRPFIEERLNQLEGASLLLLTWVSLTLCVGAPPFTLLQQLFLCVLILPTIGVLFTLALNKVVRTHAGKVTGKIISMSTAVVQRMRSRKHRRGGTTTDGSTPRAPRSVRSDSDASFSTLSPLGSPLSEKDLHMQMQERLMDTETSAI